MIDLKDPYMRNHAEETLIGCDIKGPAQSKNKNVYFLAPAQTKGRFANNHWSNFFFCKLLLNGASYGTKIGCIQLLGE